jgi:hypothetical protein
VTGVYIEAHDISSIQPAQSGQGSATRFLRIELDMSVAQMRRAVLEIMGTRMGSEPEVFEWFKSEFPEWFTTGASV